MKVISAILSKFPESFVETKQRTKIKVKYKGVFLDQE